MQHKQMGSIGESFSQRLLYPSLSEEELARMQAWAGELFWRETSEEVLPDLGIDISMIPVPEFGIKRNLKPEIDRWAEFWIFVVTQLHGPLPSAWRESVSVQSTLLARLAEQEQEIS